MLSTQNIYIVFGLVLLLALIFDLGLLSKKGSAITMRKAFWQTLFWVGLSLAFWTFLWIEKDATVATKYISAYLMEWSLSIDNIFVFILIFSFFKVGREDAGRALLIGILLAIVFRIIFIALGIQLINTFHWLLYFFGAFLLYTGYTLFFKKESNQFDPKQTKIYRWMNAFLRISQQEPHGRYIIKQNGKIYFTLLSIVVFMLGATDLVFALDSIPTVVSLVKEKATEAFTPDDILVIYSSNIFAVLGLRSLFFLLKNAVNKFKYLQHGIAVVLVFIGIKMLIEYFNIIISIYVSLGAIILCIAGAVLVSLVVQKKKSQHITQ